MSAVPLSRPEIGVRTRSKHAAADVNAQAARVALGAVMFGVVAMLTFGTSSLAGHVMVEQARRDGIRANQRMRAALAAQATLARQIEVMSNEADLMAWAKRNGFVAPDSAVRTSGSKSVTVARR